MYVCIYTLCIYIYVCMYHVYHTIAILCNSKAMLLRCVFTPVAASNHMFIAARRTIQGEGRCRSSQIRLILVGGLPNMVSI